MKKDLWFLFIVALAAVLNSSLIYGTEIMFPATQLENRFGSLVLYSARTDKTFDFQVESDNEIKAIGYSVFRNMVNDIESPGKGDVVTAKYMLNIANRYSIWLKAGTGNYEMELPSTTVRNTLSSGNNGLILGVGVRSRLLPDTIITPALSIELGLDYERYDLNNNMQSDGTSRVIDKKLEFYDYQAAVVVSKKLKFFEPYGGLKVFRTNVTLTDNSDSGKASGFKDNAGLFIGSKFNLSRYSALVAEACFVGETSFSCGLNVSF